MKHFKLFFISCSFFLSVSGQGVQFDSTYTSWEEVIQKAKQLGKPIFVDVYTSWCGPCKWMDINVFSQKEIGSFYNKNFLPIKVNAEKGFGVNFARTNKINAFPTFLFFSPDNEMLLGGTGGKPTATILRIGSDALDNWKNGVSLQEMQKIMTAGNHDPVFLKSYILKLSSLLSANSLVIEEYLKVIPEDSLYTPNTLSLVSLGYFGRMPVNGSVFKVLLNAYKAYPVKSFELMSPWNTLRSRLLEYTDSAGSQKDEQWLQEIMDAINKIDTVWQIANRERDFFLCKYYASAKDSASFMKQASNFYSNYIMNINTDSLYQFDKLHFKKALLIKFGSSDENKLKNNKNYEVFLKGYFSDTQITVNELIHIIYLYNIHFRDSNEGEINPFKSPLRSAINLYRNNPVYVNAFILKNMELE